MRTQDLRVANKTPEHILAANRAWREANPDKARESHRRAQQKRGPRTQEQYNANARAAHNQGLLSKKTQSYLVFLYTSQRCFRAKRSQGQRTAGHPGPVRRQLRPPWVCRLARAASRSHPRWRQQGPQVVQEHQGVLQSAASQPRPDQLLCANCNMIKRYEDLGLIGT